ncbi:MAG TPA: DUF711 family protein [Ktedonobacteraceae bacterium]|nr:DUF711 family protein [Ktedonobacteraceae bacterium]
MPPIRTVTLGIAQAHPLRREHIERAARILQRAGERGAEAGYEVQTLRVSTRPLFDDLPDWSPNALQAYARDLQHMLDDVEIAFCSLGPAQAARPDFPLERIDVIADMLAATSALNATVQLALPEAGLHEEAALPTARVIRRLAHETEEGFGNFRFAMLACVPPGCPFFPAAYHAGPDSLTLALQGAGVIARAARAWSESGQQGNLVAASEWVRTALLEQVAPVVALGRELAAEQSITFGGVDLSPAPMGDDSIVTGLEAFGYGVCGTPGSVAVSAALTYALKQTELPTCGYCGLMLPVLEDALLGRRWAEGVVNVHQLLLYSSVCGTGLDTIPLPGDITPEEIAHLLLDVGTMALRLNKPLSARLFPVPGKRGGEFTTFTSQYLTNTLIH